MISETTTGLVAEYIAAAAVLEQGWRVSLSQQDKVDLVAWNDDRFLRIQVKGSSLRHDSGRSPSYQFQLGSGSKKKVLPTVKDYDVIALVGIHHRRTFFLPTEAVQQYTKRINPRRFEMPEIEAETWQKAIEVVDARLG